MVYQPEITDGWSLKPAPSYLGPPNPVVGVYGLEQTSIGFDDPMLGRHILFIGGIGTGKTVGMSGLVDSIRSAATSTDVFIIFDSKGDYRRRFYEDGDAVITRAPGASVPGKVSWNLFADL